MKSIKKTTYLVAITLVIAGLMITSTAVVGTPMNNRLKKLSWEFPSVKYQSLKPQCLYKKCQQHHIHRVILSPAGTDFPVFTSDLTNQNPGIVTDGLGTILAVTEETDGSTTNLWGRWSTDGGTTWLDEAEITGWQFTTKPTLPELDYYGAGKQAWGTMVPGYDALEPLITSDYRTSPIQQVTNPNNPDGWTAWSADWFASSLLSTNIDSSDVACYSNTSHIPNPEFFGVVALTVIMLYRMGTR